MYPVLGGLTLKDFLILASLGLLFFAVLEIRKLKKKVATEIHRLLTPQLSMHMVPGLDKDSGIYLQNESSFLVRDLILEDTEFILEDFGFNIHCIVTFEAGRIPQTPRTYQAAADNRQQETRAHAQVDRRRDPPPPFPFLQDYDALLEHRERPLQGCFCEKARAVYRGRA